MVRTRPRKTYRSPKKSTKHTPLRDDIRALTRAQRERIGDHLAVTGAQRLRPEMAAVDRHRHVSPERVEDVADGDAVRVRRGDVDVPRQARGARGA